MDVNQMGFLEWMLVSMGVALMILIVGIVLMLIRFSIHFGQGIRRLGADEDKRRKGGGGRG